MMRKSYSIFYKLTAILMLTAMFTPLFSTGANAQTMAKTAAKTNLKPLRAVRSGKKNRIRSCNPTLICCKT